MDSEQTITVLTEILEDQKQIGRNQNELMFAIQALKTQVEEIETALKNQAQKEIIIDTKPVQQLMDSRLNEIKLWLEMLLKKKQTDNLLVFLESDAKKWTVYLLVAITFLTYLYWFGIKK